MHPTGHSHAAGEKLPSDMLAEWTNKRRTRSGAQVCIRPLRPEDRIREIEFIDSLSERTRYLRLLTPLQFLSPHLLDQLMDVDYDRRMAFVATAMCDGVETFVGIARYGQTDRRDAAELGITVTDAWQGEGIGRLLVHDLSRFARFRRFRQLVGIVLPENIRMLAFAKSIGFDARFDPRDHLVRISYDLVAVRALAHHRVPAH